MPFTVSIAAAPAMESPQKNGAGEPAPLRSRLRPGRSARFLRAIALGDLLLHGVLLGGGSDHGLQDAVVGVIDAGLHVPLLAIPGLDRSLRFAGVVYAAGADRRHEAGEAQLLDCRVVDGQVLQAP